MRLDIFIFNSTSLALLIPRCDKGGHASSSIDTRDVNASPAAPAAHQVAASKPPYTIKYKVTSTKTPTTTPLATRAVTESDTEASTSTCTPHSICVDAINSCGIRYGECYDENFCDGNTSPYPIPTCSTMVTVKRVAAAMPAITPA
ncbi:hypothetical protein QM012_005505 [Aureobasidium pullulans]|uniref:Uncharacterized protein n=1 Tax=Aureobasidium pullulans TaxID=5580 RepID=A0ABR0T5R3_AURPU